MLLKNILSDLCKSLLDSTIVHFVSDNRIELDYNDYKLILTLNNNYNRTYLDVSDNGTFTPNNTIIDKETKKSILYMLPKYTKYINGVFIFRFTPSELNIQVIYSLFKFANSYQIRVSS